MKAASCDFDSAPTFGGFDITVLEQHQRRDTTHAILGRGFLILVDIELGNGQLASVGVSDFVQDRGDHFAWTAPLSPIVDQYRAFGLEYVSLEASVANMF